MAIVHKNRNANRAKRLRVRLAQAACALIPAALACAWAAGLAAHAERRWLLYAALAAAAAGAAAAGWLRAQGGMLESGIEGEQQAVAALRGLPYEYHVVANPVYTVHGRTAELDAIVVGRTGVCIVETKSHSGVITGRPGDEWWTQTKRSGVKHMKNPLLQVERQREIVEALLRDAGCPCGVRTLVFFSNKNARVSVRDARICTGAEFLCREVKAGRASLSPAQVGKVVDALT